MIQRNKNLREIGFRVAFQCCTQLVQHLKDVSKSVDGSELARGRRKGAKIDPAIWHSIFDQCLSDPQKSLDQTMTDHDIVASATLGLNVSDPVV